MNSDDLATEQQLDCLKPYGYTFGQSLTRGEAAHLISDIESLRRLQAAAAGGPVPAQAGALAHQYRLAVDNARMASAEADQESMSDSQEYLNRATVARQEFWMDTCRAVVEMHDPSPGVVELYKKQGFRFFVPNQAQVKDVLEALDAVIAYWDRDHPELFHQTLEVNFPELVRQREGTGGSAI